MRKSFDILLCVITFILVQVSVVSYAEQNVKRDTSKVQEQIISLPYKEPDGISWSHPEKEYFSTEWGANAITNVSAPQLLMYAPDEQKRNGSSVILAPGGGVYALSIDGEGRNIAHWLNERGITVFILKYRLVPTGDDGIKDLIEIAKNNNAERIKRTQALLPYSVNDALEAVSYIRVNASKLKLDEQKVGMMGFSGGGVILFGVVNQATDATMPNYLVPLYPGTDLIEPKPTAATPPTLFIAAANDQLIDATLFTDIFNRWHKAGVPTGLHLFAKGGHGFGYGVWKQSTPSDNWLERYYEWAVSEGFISTQ